MKNPFLILKNFVFLKFSSKKIEIKPQEKQPEVYLDGDIMVYVDEKYLSDPSDEKEI